MVWVGPIHVSVIRAGVAGIVDPVFEIAVRMETSVCKHFNLALAGLPAPVNQSQPYGQPLISKGVKWLLFLGGKIIKRDGYRIGSLFLCFFVCFLSNCLLPSFLIREDLPLT